MKTEKVEHTALPWSFASINPAQLNPPSVEQIQRDNPHMDGLTRVDVRRTNRGVYVAIVSAYSTKYTRECRADYVWSDERQRWELGAN